MEAGSRKSQPGQLWQSILGIRSYKGLGNIFNGFNHKNSQNALQPVSNGSREKLLYTREQEMAFGGHIASLCHTGFFHGVNTLMLPEV
jgi:hypothetical protein